MEQLKSNEGFFGWVPMKLINKIGMNEDDAKFLIETFKSNLKQEVQNWNDKNSNGFNSMPDVFNFATTLLRNVAAFPYQEDVKMNEGLIKFLNMMFGIINSDNGKQIHDRPSDLTYSLNTLNHNLDRFSTFPLISYKDSKVSCRGGKVNDPIEVFPGLSKCKQTTRHSVWHAQSAKGILDMIKFLDEFIGKRRDMQLDLNFFDDTIESATEQIRKTKEQIEEVGEKITSIVDKGQSLIPNIPKIPEIPKIPWI